MPTPDEKNVMEILDEEGEGGELSEVKIANFIGVRLDYIRTILGSMGRRDFIDVFASGKVRLAEKGWRALGKSPSLPYGIEPSGAPESPEERYKRWLEGKPRQKSKENQKLKEEKSQEKKDVATVLRETSSGNLSPQEKFKKWAAG